MTILSDVNSVRHAAHPKWNLPNLTNPTMYLSHITQYNIFEQKCTQFCSNVVHCGIWNRCIVGFICEIGLFRESALAKLATARAIWIEKPAGLPTMSCCLLKMHFGRKLINLSKLTISWNSKWLSLLFLKLGNRTASSSPSFETGKPLEKHDIKTTKTVWRPTFISEQWTQARCLHLKSSFFQDCT